MSSVADSVSATATGASLLQEAFGYFGHMWELYAFYAFLPVLLAAFGRHNVYNALAAAAAAHALGIPAEIIYGFPVTCTAGKYELVKGLEIACQKRPVSREQIEALAATAAVETMPANGGR
mgnify:CR=1 FL=1